MKRPTVKTRTGVLHGIADRGARVFRGVPYAVAPLGERRFLPPERLETPHQQRDCAAFSPSPVQPPLNSGVPGFEIGEQSEDCLTLNVFRPDNDETGLPVMVWIPGGAFLTGSASQPMYDGVPLAVSQRVVLVTVNYRLGLFGSLDLRSLGFAPSGLNNGLRDQLSALEWVRDDIVAFGGDPSNVTLFGESAGATSVACLMAAPRGRGLFRRAILQSCAVSHLLSVEQRARVAATVQQFLGGRVTLDQLRQIPATELSMLGLRAQAVLLRQGIRLSACPTVDGELLPRDPLEAIYDGSASGIDVLAGTARDEYTLFALMRGIAPSIPRARVERLVGRAVGGVERAQFLYDRYEQARAGSLPATPYDIYCAIETDRIYRLSTLGVTDAQVAHRPPWVYLFQWDVADPRLRSCHTVELPFVFGHVEDENIAPFLGTDESAVRLQEKVMQAWGNFARHGTPVHAHLPSWQPYDTASRPTMVLGPSPELRRDPLGTERSVWSALL